MISTDIFNEIIQFITKCGERKYTIQRTTCGKLDKKNLIYYSKIILNVIQNIKTKNTLIAHIW